MEKSDLVRLKHMLDSTQAILDFTKGKKRTSINTNRLLFSAILREFEVLGEAAGKISLKTRGKFAEIPWKKLVGMRNRLIHAYFDVDRDIIWKTIRDYLPKLRKHLLAIVEVIGKESE
jgi:uncharacterized protein with HEPN domain